MMYGMDLSHYQDAIDLSTGKYDFCIIKATEGIGFIDQSFHKYEEQLTVLKKNIGFYHFARPDYHGTVEKMQEEAKWFISVLRTNELLKKGILVLDWEREPMDREDLVSAWCETVVEETGITPFIYGSRSKINKWKSLGWKVITKYPIWLASWPSIKRVDVGVAPNFALPQGDWKIWQYASNGIYPGFNGNVDLDMTRMDKIQWDGYARGVKMDDEKDVEKQKEVLTPAMQWCIEKGIFVGDGNGNYMPKDFLTREQAAQIIYNIIHNKEVK